MSNKRFNRNQYNNENGLLKKNYYLERSWTRLGHINVWVLFTGHHLLRISTRTTKDISKFRIYVRSSAKSGKT